MAISTRGHMAPVLPSVQFADPVLLGGGLSALGPAVERGANLGMALEQAAFERSQRPLREQILMAQLESIPLNRRLQELQISEAQRRAAIPVELIEGVDISGGAPRRSIQDFNVPFEELRVVEEFTPQVKTTRGQRYLADGKTEQFSRPETMRTAEQVRQAAEQRKLETAKTQAQIKADEALATQRLREREFSDSPDVQLIEGLAAAEKAGDATRAQLYRDLIEAKKKDRLVSNQLAAYRAALDEASLAGVTPEQALALRQTPDGAAWLSAQATRGAILRRGQVAPSALINELAPSPGPMPSVSTASPGSARSFNTEQEAAAAAAAGLIKAGDRISVAGQVGTWQ